MCSDRTRIWNSVEVHNMYQWLGGTHLSRRSHVNYLSKTLNPDLLVFSSPGVALILVFRSHTGTELRIVDDLDECNEQVTSRLAKRIKSECLNNKPDSDTYPTRLPLDYITGNIDFLFCMNVSWM